MGSSPLQEWQCHSIWDEKYALEEGKIYSLVKMAALCQQIAQQIHPASGLSGRIMYGLKICIGTGFDVCEITSCLLPITHSTLTNSSFLLKFEDFFSYGGFISRIRADISFREG